MQQRRLIDSSEGNLAHRRLMASHLDAMLALCETTDCRRTQLLAYFSERAVACGNCDTCLSPPQTWDGTVPAQKLLSTIVRLERERDQRYGAGQVIDILLGKKTAKVSENGHHELKTFGIGIELNESQWRGVVRQLLAQGLLAVQGEYQTLASPRRAARCCAGSGRSRCAGTCRSRAAARLPRAGGLGRGRRAARLGRGAEAGRGRPVARSRKRSSSGCAPGAAPPPRSRACPPTWSSTTRPCARSRSPRPSTLGELAAINGVGESKLAKYGEGILGVLHE